MQSPQFGSLGREAKEKLNSDNDIKIIIQGKNSQTGIGKTTLAIQLCRYIDDNWSAESHSFVDTKEYVDAHLNMPKGSALLIDEIEAGADRRRAMSEANVELSKAWATMRARNIATVATLPSISMLDSRMLELADFWVLVKRRGLAQPYRVRVNDFNPQKLPQRKPLPGNEHIRFPDLPDDDRDKAHLDEIKDEMLEESGSSHIRKSEHQKKVEKTGKEARKEVRNQAIRELYEKTDLTTTELSEKFEFVDISQSHITRVL